MPYRAMMALVAAIVMTLSGSALAQKAADPTTDGIKLNSSKSNIGSATSGGGAGKTNDTLRMGGGGGAKGGVQLNPQPEPPGSKAK